jgi:predicted TIM-barrel fold metal-dependent hydrolase
MIIDAHAHIGSWPTLKESEYEIVESNKKYKISFTLLSDCDCSEFPSIHKYPAHIVSQEFGLRKVLQFVKHDPKHFGAAVWINPHNQTVTDELKDLIKKNREYIYALKMHPFESHLRITSPRMKPYLELAREFQLPILVHTAQDKYSDVRFLGMVARANPDLTFIAAHLQLCSDNQAAIEEMKVTPNLYADTAWVDMKKAKKVLLEIGENRIMFGTDNPIDGLDTLNNPMYQAYYRNKVKLPGHLYSNLMWRNAATVYKLPVKEKKA